MEDIPFLVARRRNAQRRNGRAWMDRLGEAAALDPGSIRLVEAAQSVAIERQKQQLLRDGLVSGVVVRTPGVGYEDASRAWESFLSRWPVEAVVCCLHRHPDFMFAIKAEALLGRLGALLSFDGDTVGAMSSDLSRGLVVDMCIEETDTTFELDRWGGW